MLQNLEQANAFKTMTEITNYNGNYAKYTYYT